MWISRAFGSAFFFWVRDCLGGLDEGVEVKACEGTDYPLRMNILCPSVNVDNLRKLQLK